MKKLYIFGIVVLALVVTTSCRHRKHYVYVESDSHGNHGNHGHYEDDSYTESHVYVESAPPALIVESYRPRRPKYDSVWIDGHWRWNGHKYYWVSGHWKKIPRGYKRWQRGHWTKKPRGWIWIRGSWY